MTKEVFLTELRAHLCGVPVEDAEKSVEYYNEMIEDRIEDGLTEEEAVAAIGDPRTEAERIIRNTPLVRIVKERLKPKRKLSGGTIALIVCTFPIWLPVLALLFGLSVGAFGLVFGLGLGVLGVLVGVAATPLGFAVAAINAIIMGEFATGLMYIGTALIIVGICIPLGIGVYRLLRLLVRLIIRCIGRIKLAVISRKDGNKL